MNKNVAKNIFRVGLIFEQNTLPYPEKVALGIVRIARMLGNWHFTMDEGLPFLSNKTVGWKGDGIITDTTNIKDLREQMDLGNTPIVTLSDASYDPPCPRVTNDDYAIGRIGAQHLMQLANRNFAFIRWGSFAFSAIREEGFTSELHKFGHPCSIIEIPFLQRKVSIKRIKSWLKSCNYPAAVMAPTDDVAILFMQICDEAGIRIPRDIAILGVNNVTLVCEMLTPTLSSITRNGEEIGVEAAKLLHRMMSGEDVGTTDIRVPPVGITQRASTSFIYSDDDAIEDAMRYIHNHANQPISVSDVVNSVLITRRTLELRFRKMTNRTIYDEIRQVHVQHACRLLRETNRTIGRIAHESGFTDKGRMHAAFNKITGMTPEQYRRENS
jgi:LacI family transcriptional regulator